MVESTSTVRPKVAKVMPADQTTPRVERCGTCRWWVPIADRADGACHRHAPNPRAQRRQAWPRTLPEDWCGEFARRTPASRG